MGTNEPLNKLFIWGGVAGIGSVVFATIFGFKTEWMLNFMLVMFVFTMFGSVVDFNVLLERRATLR